MLARSTRGYIHTATQSYSVSNCQGFSNSRKITYQDADILSSVMLGIGLLRLKSRMRTLYPNWKPTYLTTKVSVILVSAAVVSVNIIILVMTALPTSGAVPNYYWPVTIVGFIAAGVAYWAVLRLLEVKEPKRTLGSKLGLEVGVYEQGDEDIPDEMRLLMHEAELDGSRRRLRYKVRQSCLFQAFSSVAPY